MLPASSAQARLFFIEELLPGRATYNVPLAVRLRGVVDLAALQSAVTGLVTRHEVLRTTFASREDMMVQVIHSPREVAVRVREFPGQPDAAWAALLADANVPFDLRSGPVIRVALYRIATDEQLLLLTLHHVAADGWSVGVLQRELEEGYAAAVAGRAPTLAPLPVQYADYALWQQGELAGPHRHALEAFWRRQLAGVLPVSELPMKRSRPAVAGGRPVGRVPVRVNAVLAARLDALARREQATPFMLYCAVFQLLLARYGGQEDVIVGTPISNRDASGLDGLMGLFLNTIALRVDCSGNPSFRELLKRVRKVALGAFAHASLPFERVIEVVKPPRNEAITPIFQVMFSLQNATAASNAGLVGGGMNFAGTVSEPLRGVLESTKFELQLTLVPDGSAWRGTIDYDADLFDGDMVARFGRHYLRLLEQMADAPDAPAGQAPLLDAEEEAVVARKWNDTTAPIPPWSTPQRMHELAVAQPHAIAVQADDATLSYAELDARAARVAERLRAAGVRPGDRVAVMVERTTVLPISLLGVWRAGAAYVPLDAGYPAARIAQVLADASVAAIVTDAASSVQAAESLGAATAPVVTLTADTWAEAATPGSEAPATWPGGDSVAYVIFTSGSTGRPKGVAIPHRALTNFLASMADRPGLEAGDALVAVTTIAFDIAGLELWLPLTTGARVVLASRDTAMDGGALRALLEATAEQAAPHRTMLQATPATYRLLLDAGWVGGPRVVMLCGGEGWPDGLAAALLPRGEAVWNVYGPTETTIWSTRYQVHDPELSLGEPLANTTLHVLDPYGVPLPIDVPGELWIGGAGLAVGYLGRDDLTAERFVTHPVLGRIYRTGDRVRRHASGRLAYLGRLDDQVKVRGFRIELGDIEAALLQQTGVHEAAAVVHTDDKGETRLAAFVVPTRANAVDVATLTAAVARTLPAYMLPSSIGLLEALPLTPNGKLDRRALPTPSFVAPARPKQPPTDDLQRAVAHVWNEVLRTAVESIEATFEELGGHSLLATRVTAQLGRIFRTSLSLRAFFDAPTIAGVAATLARLEAKPGQARLIAATFLKVQRMTPEEREQLRRASQPKSPKDSAP